MKSEAWVGDWLQKSENIVREEHMSEFTIAIVSTALMWLRPMDFFPNHFYVLFYILLCH